MGEDGLLEIKNFFDYKTLAEFRADWIKLSDEEKQFFRTEVKAELNRQKAAE